MSGNRGFRRSFRTPPGYKQEPGGRTALFNQTYLGFVKSSEDALMMGRLRVWIPEFSSDQNDESTWFTVNYCSPFAGATPPKLIKKGGKELTDTQQSYGWWAVPPDIDNEVIVMFINGDPNRGVWIGSLYQQYMNHMVPGIASNNSFKEGAEGINPPVAEYNKWGGGVGNSDDPTRPRFDPLHTGLYNQGLYEDSLRGPSDSSARRNPISGVYGFKSPSGSHLVFDDSADNQHIRIRTATGAQIIINDTVGFVYIISANGNSWLEVSDDGVDVYSSKSVSMRSQGDFNIHADGAINMYAKKSFNVYGGGGGSMQFGRNLDVLTGGETKISSAGNLNLLSQASVSTSAGGKLSLEAGGVMGIASGGALGLTAGGQLVLSGSKIQQNGSSGIKPTTAAEASAVAPSYIEDREVNASKGYPEIDTNTIVSRMPTHEPWNGHPSSKSAATLARVDLSVSRRTAIDGNNPGASDSDDIQPGDQEPVETDDTEFVAPVTGPVTSDWGPRNVSGGSRFHKGIDVGIPTGTPIVASRAGVVTKAGSASGYGIAVFIKHDNGYTTEYGHISAPTVRTGQSVKAGQQIARSGNTGRSTGPHLHFTIKKNGSAIDPAKKLKNAKRGRRLTAGRN